MERELNQFQEEIPIAIKIIDIKTSPADFIKRFLPREINISKLGLGFAL